MPELKAFTRGLSPKSLEALKGLSKESNDNWWKDVLKSESLLLAVRGGYLNAYAKGQSVFKIEFEQGGVNAGQPRPAIHYKYLVRPELETNDIYVPFNGKSFQVEPGKLVYTLYEAGVTLPQIIKTAEWFSGPEKVGVHKIAKNEPKVIDLEIAFSGNGDGSNRSAPRMDIAVLIPNELGDASLVFCEAKCADNPELEGLENNERWQRKNEDGRLSERQIAVVAQIAKYEEFLQDDKNQAALVDAYIDVCKTLVAFHGQGGVRPLDDLIRKVAKGCLPLSIHPQIYLLVYGFDDDQKKGAVRRRLDMLRAKGLRIIEKGNPSSFHLAADIKRIMTRSIHASR